MTVYNKGGEWARKEQCSTQIQITNFDWSNICTFVTFQVKMLGACKYYNSQGYHRPKIGRVERKIRFSYPNIVHLASSHGTPVCTWIVALLKIRRYGSPDNSWLMRNYNHVFFNTQLQQTLFRCPLTVSRDLLAVIEKMENATWTDFQTSASLLRKRRWRYFLAVYRSASTGLCSAKWIRSDLLLTGLHTLQQ